MDASDDAENEKIAKMKEGHRRAAISASAISEESMKDWKKPYYEKTEEVRQRIKGIIDENPKLQVLFGHLTEASIFDVIDAMAPQSVDDGSTLITQGEQGDNFYIVDEGTFDAFVQRGDSPPDKVLEYKPGAMFGELALMYDAPRAATVKATSPSKVFALDRFSFKLMLSTSESVQTSQHEDFLADLDIFKHLTRYELASLSNMLESELFDAGEEILKQGQAGTNLFIVVDGEAKAYIDGEHGEIEVKHYKVAGEYFGEVALITGAPRSATVRAAGSGCSLLSVSREDFERVLGPVQKFLVANIAQYRDYKDILNTLTTNQQ